MEAYEKPRMEVVVLEDCGIATEERGNPVPQLPGFGGIGNANASC